MDGSDGNMARQIMGKIDAIVRTHSGSRVGFVGSPPLAVKVYTLWNPASRSATYSERASSELKASSGLRVARTRSVATWV